MLTETVAGRTYDYSHTVGRATLTGVGFSFPVDLALDSEGIAYVINRGREELSDVAWDRTGVGLRISRVSLGSRAGEEEYLGDFSEYGIGPGALIWPAGVAANKHGRLYVTDEWTNRISVFDKEGNFLHCWDAVQQGDDGPNGISGIAVDPDDTLYITDGRSHQVRRFAADGSFLGSWGHRGDGVGELDSPWGITLDAEGFVYVADHLNHRVQKFTADGRFVAQFGGPGTKKWHLNHPTDVAVDLDGDVYVCDWSQNDWQPGRVKIYDAEGKLLTCLAGDAQQLSKWAQMTVDANADYIKRRREVYSTEPEWAFALPTSVEFDGANNRLLVADTQRDRIQIYNKLSGYLVPQLNL